MRKLIVIISTLAILASTSTYLMLTDRSEKNSDSESTDGKKNEVAEAIVEVKVENTYYIKKYGEKIGVFRKGAGKPFKVIDTFVFTLPQADIVLLSQGFTINESELSGIIEDYTG